MGLPPNAAGSEPLPDDVAALKALLLAERATTTRLTGQNEHLRALIKELQRALFGRRSEKTVPSRPARSKTSSRRSPKPRGKTRRPTRRYKRRADSSVVSIAARCPGTCRGTRS